MEVQKEPPRGMPLFPFEYRGLMSVTQSSTGAPRALLTNGESYFSLSSNLPKCSLGSILFISRMPLRFHKRTIGIGRRRHLDLYKATECTRSRSSAAFPDQAEGLNFWRKHAHENTERDLR